MHFVIFMALSNGESSRRERSRQAWKAYGQIYFVNASLFTT